MLEHNPLMGSFQPDGTNVSVDPKRTIYYKAGFALPDGRGLRSIVAERDWSVTYEAGRLASHGNTPLFVFASLGSAIYFVKHLVDFDESYEIWAGYSTMPPLDYSERTAGTRGVLSFFDREYWGSYWQEAIPHALKGVILFRTPPTGTEFVSNFMLTRKMWDQYDYDYREEVS
jgi:hypothetical protein